jgi:Acetoacetate decarboxylase (ADC)
VSDGGLPAYVERPGEQVLGPPYVAMDARLNLLFVDADIDRLNDLIDASLNTPLLAQFGVTPAFQASRPTIIFMFAVIPRMYSNAEAYLDGVKQQPTDEEFTGLELTLRGDYVREVELSVWIPLVRTIYGQHTPGFYLPFVFNDSPASIATGREVYGYPKQLASFACDPDDKAPTSIELTTWHIPNKEPPTGSKYEPNRLLRINLPTSAAMSGSQADGAQVTRVEDFRVATAEAFGEAPAAGRPRLRFASLPPDGRQEPDRNQTPAANPASAEFAANMVRAAPLYFLRQFRDPVHPGRATDQRLIEARFVIQRMPATKRIVGGGASIEFDTSRTLDLPTVLGLDPETPTPIRESLVIEDLTFTVDLGKELLA